MHKLVIENVKTQIILLQLERYVLDYIIDKIHIKKADQHFFPYRRKYYTTLDGTKVRSKSEQFIADWFYRHSIKYEYEPLLNVKDFLFIPIFIYQMPIYILNTSVTKAFPQKDKEEQFQRKFIAGEDL